MRWFPKSKLGKVSFWAGISGFALVYLQYWFAMLFQTSVPPVMGILAMLCVCAAGVTSVISLTKYGDRAILLFLSAFIGLLGIVFVLGEFLFPH
jgi:hypothetical protein